MEPRITVERTPRPEEQLVVEQGLLEFNRGFIGDPAYSSFAVFVRDDAGRAIGGLYGHVRWRWMYVAKFWLPESLRGLGLGSRLLAAAEDLARERDCIGVYLDTFEYQALPFYLKQGYAVFGVHEGCPPGYRQYHLSKRLDVAQ